MAMASTVLYFIILFVCQQSLIGIARGDFIAFDFFTLSLIWPPGGCNRLHQWRCRINPIPQNFTIHGLWPTNVYGPMPLNCEAPNYEYEWIEESPLRDSLNRIMPNLIGGLDGNQQNWGYQWNRHGRCSLLWFSELDYFEFAVEKADQLDIISLFRANNIVPGQSYPPQYIEAVVQSVTQLRVVLFCTQDNQTRQQLVQILFCYDSRNYFNMMDCPVRGQPTCTADEVFFSNVGL